MECEKVFMPCFRHSFVEVKAADERYQKKNGAQESTTGSIELVIGWRPFGEGDVRADQEQRPRGTGDERAEQGL
jgi:hypothetical protein